MKYFMILLIVICFVGTVLGESLERKIPLKAATLSLIPGGGQIYNESYLKAGIVIGLEAGFISLAIFNNKKSNDFHEKYKISESALDYDNYVFYYNKKQSDYFWIGTVLFLSMIDAYVDAHLHDFKAKKKKVDLKFQDQTLLISYKF